MKTRHYFNLTNKCNTECSFCCMNSGPSKNTFLDFNKFKQIIDNCEGEFEMQLEGGEPLLHPNLFLFLEYAYFTKKCSKIIISTNGTILNKHIDRLIDFVHFNKIPMLIKHSINFHLAKLNPNIYKECRDLYLATEFINDFDIRFNVRIKNNNDEIIEKLKEFKIYNQSTIYPFQSYGRYSGNEEYSKPFIVQNIEQWFIYSCDGICFGQDLVARSVHEGCLK